MSRRNDKTFITGEREEVICIIYAVFSTIISDIPDRFFLSPHLLCFSCLPLTDFIKLTQEKKKKKGGGFTNVKNVRLFTAVPFLYLCVET